MPLRLSNKIALFFLVVTIAIVVGVVATRNNHTAPTIAITHAVRRDLKSWISSNGKVEPIVPQVIQSKLTTFVKTVTVKEGQIVRAGDPLMLLDGQDLETQLTHVREQLVTSQDEAKTAAGGGDPVTLAELRNNLAKTETEIAHFRREQEALERLLAKQAATRQEVEQNRTTLAKAEADKHLFEQQLEETRQRAAFQTERVQLKIDEARASIRTLEEKLKSATVRAIANGTVYSLPARSGMFVHEGDTLAELADLSRLRIRIFVDEPDLGSLKTGQPVEITWDGLPSRIWSGRVEQLPNTVVARGSRNVGEVLCSVDEINSQLLPNTNIYAKIRIAEKENSLSVPRSAVRTEGNKHFIFVVDSGRVRKQEVDVGISNSTDYEILHGITEQDTIAIPGGSELRDGLAVNVS